MAYDVALADRVREHLLGEPGLNEKRMFGGLAFLINGHLAVSASSRGGLLLRVDPAQTDVLIQGAEAERFVMRGRELDGWLHVTVPAATPEAELEQWIDRGVEYARSLPPRA